MCHWMEADTSVVLLVHHWMVASLMVCHWMVANLVVCHWMVANLMVHRWLAINLMVQHCWLAKYLVVQRCAVDRQRVERGWLGRRLDRVDCLKSIWRVCQCHRALGRLRISKRHRHMVDV